MRTYILLLLTFYCSIWIVQARSDNAHAHNRRKLVYLQILTTNGLFAPLQLYPNDKNPEIVWPDGLGSLTKLGKIQHYEFGKLLRKHYQDFITSAPTEIDAFSSEEDRSTHSVLCLLASLYAPTDEWEFSPGFHWQPIPVSYLDIDDIFFRYPENCLTQILEKQHLYNSSPGKDFIKQDELFYSYWSNHSGARIDNWNDVAILYDTLEKEKSFGYQVPHWAEKYWFDLRSITNAAYSWNYKSVKSLQLKVGSLISLMTLRMQAKTVEPDPIKVSVYMTHDWNLAAFLSALGLYNGYRPPPCATIAIEMFHQPYNNQYSVRMLFYNSTNPESGNQSPHLLQLSHCSKYCPLKAFVDHFQDFIPENFAELCQEYIDSDDEFKEYLRNSTLGDYH